MRTELFFAAATLIGGVANAQTSDSGAMFTPNAKGVVAITPPSVPAGSFLGGGATCAAPTVAGVGSVGGVPFDNTTAPSMSVTNPFEVACEHNGVNGIDREGWYSWTASMNGVARLTTCALTTVDTKIAVYADDCPNIAMLDPIACKDDSLLCGGGTNFQTVMDWEITNGATYLIQLGAFNPGGGSTGGPGAFDITEFAPLPDGAYDIANGTAITATGNGGTNTFDFIMGNTYDAGLGATLSSVDIAWGVMAAVPAIPAGAVLRLVIYSGDTTGLTYLADQVVVPTMPNTNTYENYPLTAPINVTGLYSVGVYTQFVPTDGAWFPFGWVDTVNSLDTVGNYVRSWQAIENVTLPLDFMDPSTAIGPPASTQFYGTDKLWLIRANTDGVVGNFPSSCNGDGGNQMGCTDCPCGNNATPGTVGGCSNSAGTSTQLMASGNPSVSLPSGSTTDLQFTATGSPPNATNVLISGNAVAPAGMANPCFGLDSGILAADRDGLRCIVQATVRHGNRSANAMGEIMDPSGPNRVWGGPAQPVDGLAVQGGFASGQTRFFQITHRDDVAAVCMRGLNTSQAVEVTFTP